MTKKVKLKFDAILEGFEFVSSVSPTEHAAFICRKTGDVIFYSEHLVAEEPLPEDIDETGKFISIPHKNDLDLGKSLALKFTAEVLPGAIRDVEGIFSRAGAYSRFKDFLTRSDKLEQWYEYEKREQENALRAWCQLNDLEVDG